MTLSQTPRLHAGARTLLAAVGVSAAALLLPTTASAQAAPDALDCQRTEARMVQAVLGGSLADCDLRAESFAGGGLELAGGDILAVDHHRGQRRGHHRGNRGYRGRGHERRGYRGRGYERRGYDGRGYDGRGFDDRGFGGFRSEREVRFLIEQLKAEDRDLKRRLEYRRDVRLERRRDDIRREVKQLKRIEDRFQKTRRDRRDYRREYRRSDYDRRGRRIY